MWWSFAVASDFVGVRFASGHVGEVDVDSVRIIIVTYNVNMIIMFII